ncbi:MAG: tRNA 2-thiouridine(34) synthase MnmA [Chlamydiales bacterium]
MKKPVVAVGMSGGVDSSVAALLLKEQGYEVFGLFMRNWEEGEDCPAEADFADMARVCDQIGIPYYTVNFTKEYWDEVFSECLNDFKKGITPNPDILCNRQIKFHHLLEKAKRLGADKLATGHYCQIGPGGTLLRGADPNKDQSYFLHAVLHDKLKQTLFPIGHLPKPEVREIAKKQGLFTHAKKDSTGICFIGKRAFRPFLSQFLKPKPGPFQTLEGNVLGTHEGAHLYTIGQRKGLGIGGPGEAWFVADKDVPKNIVYLVQGENHPTLLKNALIASNPIWISGVPPEFPLTCTAKIRYRQEDSSCTVTKKGELLHVTFKDPQKAVTPGQSVVFYQGNSCLGGATISK